MRLMLIKALALAVWFGPAALRAEVPQVVTDIAPVHSLVAGVMGDLGSPELLLAAGADPHAFQLRPSQARALEQAELVVWIGPELTPWLERPLGGQEAEGRELRLLANPATALRSFADGAVDPHAWLDPQVAAAWTEAIAEALAHLDPENAATYRQNATGQMAVLLVLDAQIADDLAPFAERPFVVSHDGYGYFSDRYNLRIVEALTDGDGVPAGAATLAALRADLAAGAGAVAAAAAAVCIFPEALHDPASAEALVRDSGLQLGAPLDPMGGLQSPGPELYPALLRGLAEALTACLGPG